MQHIINGVDLSGATIHMTIQGQQPLPPDLMLRSPQLWLVSLAAAGWTLDKPVSSSCCSWLLS